MDAGFRGVGVEVFFELGVLGGRLLWRWLLELLLGRSLELGLRLNLHLLLLLRLHRILIRQLPLKYHTSIHLMHQSFELLSQPPHFLEPYDRLFRLTDHLVACGAPAHPQNPLVNEGEDFRSTSDQGAAQSTRQVSTATRLDAQNMVLDRLSQELL